MSLVIGLDVGTTATKAVAADAGAVVYATGEAGYELRLPRAGRVELDPADLQQAVIRALRDVAGQLEGTEHHIGAVCVSAAMHGLLPFDRERSPSGPVLTWADTRADE